jgi:hypothetical protein
MFRQKVHNNTGTGNENQNKNQTRQSHVGSNKKKKKQSNRFGPVIGVTFSFSLLMAMCLYLISQFPVNNNPVRFVARTFESKGSSECAKHAFNRIHVAILGQNQGAWLLHESVESVLNQKYPAQRHVAWLYDDGSDDSATLRAFKEVCGGDHEIEYLLRNGGGRHGLDTLNFRGEPYHSGDVRCLCTEERLGPGLPGAKDPHGQVSVLVWSSRASGAFRGL